MKTYLIDYADEEIEKNVQCILEQMRAGRSIEQIKKAAKEKLDFFDELVSIAKARIKNTKTTKKLLFTEEDLRFATPDSVAAYRAERLQCNTLLEIGCGVGFQTIAFAKTCKKVIAVDIDQRKVSYAQRNCRREGIKNVIFIIGDALSSFVLSKIQKEQINTLFLDPERLPTEQERSIETITPDIKKIVEIYGCITKNMCIELPPQMHTILFSCEKEYVSVDGKINRLHIYLGKLQKNTVSALMLPKKEKIVDNDKKREKNKITHITKQYASISDVDEAVVKAELIERIPFRGDILFLKEKCFFLSEKKIRNTCLKTYHILAITEEKDLIDALQKLRIGKTILRGEIPEKEYWKKRKEIEVKLQGEKTCQLFFFDKIIIAEK